MKKSLLVVPALFSALILLNGCSTNKLTIENRKAGITQSKETSASNFVKMNDGSIRHFHSLKLVTGAFKSPYLLADGTVKIQAKQIQAYQNDEHYAISQNNFINGRRSYVAVETLPGFAIRIAKGKLNVYAKKFYNGQAAVDEFFLQSGTDGQILAYTPDLMKTMIRDNHEALAFFTNEKDKEKNNISRKIQVTVELYNNTQLMSKN